MHITIFNAIKSVLNQGHVRSIKAKKNILGSIFIKGGSIAISLLLVPLTINYVNPTRYGIWLTLSSIIGWFSFFDVGLSNGLRNKFAIAKAEGDSDTAQIYVSTTYAILAIVFFSIWLLFVVVNPFLDWTRILNIDEALRKEVSTLAMIVFTYFCLQFVLRIVTTLLVADQNSAKASLIDVLGQLLSLILIFILIKTTTGSLLYLGIALCISPLIILVGANYLFFQRKYKEYRPVLSKVDFSYAKGLFNLGLIFFIIQIAGVVQYQTGNIIIANSFSLADVTSYNIVFKYFGMLNMVFTIFVIPFWSTSTEAFIKNDISWIKNGIKKYNYLLGLLLLAGIAMLIFSEQIYFLWLGDKVDIPFSLSFWGLVFFCVSMFAGKYLYFLNGISALRIQFIACIISPIVYIGLVYLFIDYFNWGVFSIFLAAVLANFNGYLLAPLQYHKIINKNKKGIWIK